MKVKTIIAGKNHISELVAKKVTIKNTQDALDIIGNASSEYLVLYEHNFEKDFFDLRTGKLGDVLQKFTNYHIKLAIIGNFDRYSGEALKDFIYESNKHGEYLFVSSLKQVIKIWER